MPPLPLILLLIVVISAAGLTVWALTTLGASAVIYVLPLALIAAIAARRLRK